MPTTDSQSTSKKYVSKGNIPDPLEVDKDYLYGRYQKAQDARTKLEQDRARWMYQFQRQTAHKAVDEPIEDDMAGDFLQHVDNTKTQTQTGMGWKELAVIAALVAGTGAATAYVTNKNNAPAVVQPADPPVQQPSIDTNIVPGIRFGPTND